MLPEKKEKIESILGRELSTEESSRLDRIKDILKIHDNDALWDIIIALEYQKHYYDTLPNSIKQSLDDFTNNFKNVSNHSSDFPLLNLQLSKIQKIFYINILLLFFLIFNCISMWVGYSIAVEESISFNVFFTIPFGYFFSIFSFVLGFSLLLYGMNALALKNKKWKIITIASVFCIALSLLPFVRLSQ